MRGEAMETNTTVTPKVGYYLVRTVDAGGVRTHLVGKDKHCTCGGRARRWCSHIRAVAAYLKAGGDRAPEGDGSGSVHDSDPLGQRREIGEEVPEACPICGAEVERLAPRGWRCLEDSSHYYRWRGERNGGAIRKFLTQPHPAKHGPFYGLTTEERDTFLTQAAHRLHAGGYTPHNS
jgi:hypothetical protein